MKKIFISLICTALLIMPSFAKNVQLVPECETCGVSKVDNSGLYKNYAEQVRKERAVILNALQLSDEQSKCAFEINQETNKVLDEQFYTLNTESMKLRNLKSNLADSKTIKSQEKVINNVKKDINRTIKNENKKIKKILNGEQKSKLRMIEKLQRKSVKSSKKRKNYYKSNPKMRQFAPHIKCD